MNAHRLKIGRLLIRLRTMLFALLLVLLVSVVTSAQEIPDIDGPFYDSQGRAWVRVYWTLTSYAWGEEFGAQLEVTAPDGNVVSGFRYPTVDEFRQAYDDGVWFMFNFWGGPGGNYWCYEHNRKAGIVAGDESVAGGDPGFYIRKMNTNSYLYSVYVSTADEPVPLKKWPKKTWTPYP